MIDLCRGGTMFPKGIDGGNHYVRDIVRYQPGRLTGGWLGGGGPSIRAARPPAPPRRPQPFSIFALRTNFLPADTVSPKM